MLPNTKLVDDIGFAPATIYINFVLRVLVNSEIRELQNFNLLKFVALVFPCLTNINKGHHIIPSVNRSIANGTDSRD